MPIVVPQPTKEQWQHIANGVPEFPKLHDFRDVAANTLQVHELENSTMHARSIGKGPACYEESHRQYAAWRYYTELALGLKGRFVRIKGKSDVERLTVLTETMLHLSAEPWEYLQLFVSTLSGFRTFESSKIMSIRYVLCDKLISQIGAKISARNMGLEKQRQADRHHSFSVQSTGTNPEVTKARKTLELAGFTELSDEQIKQVVESAKLASSGVPSFMSKRTRELVSVLNGKVE